jgi:mannose-6-phosphate isomerase-like protein (cupin superfamily)
MRYYMREEISRLDPASEFYTVERCYITELSNIDADPDVSIARARVLPGVTTRWHRLNGVTERYVVISGSGRIDVGSLSPQAIGSGDVVLIPSGCAQRITNIGNEDLIFLAICTPRFQSDVYEDIDPDPISKNG